jgi:lactoylglutathione lyase
VRVADAEASLRFYRDALGLEVVSVKESTGGRNTQTYLAAPGDREAQIELTAASQ